MKKKHKKHETEDAHKTPPKETHKPTPRGDEDMSEEKVNPASTESHDVETDESTDEEHPEKPERY